ncbi:hypothetical protein [Janthinobacterium sp. B9-8]|uniref:hypothetical protein n=1 Tax=Janthinobacterium sp. B9-8 TaxID=1236179 RepID=UPI00069AA6E5|nr:hypothetical protein [Janthinobacterium sp. B9-8]AMC35822.1 hypothetical protein VN23_14995 [Janthinobacterium sp. B9-8]
MNPEFKRNLWLTFSTPRLIGMPAILALIFLAVGMNTELSKLGSTAVTLFVGIVWLWGTKNAAAAIGDEQRDHTWDQQRMSALSPWEMTWGKLFGATLFNWYGGALCLLMLLVAELPASPINAISKALSMIAIGLLLHGSALVINLQLGQSDLAQNRRGSFNLLLAIPAFFMMPSLFEMGDTPIVWWDISFLPLQFQLLAGSFFAICSVFAAWRLMQNALQVRTRPWAWPLFACLLAGFIAGFKHENWAIPGLIICSVMTYAMLFAEPNGFTVWQRVITRIQSQNWHGALINLPLWPTTLMLSFVFALLASGSGVDEFSVLSSTPLAIALILLRDSAICLFLALNSNSKRVLASSLLYLAIINGLLPFLAHSSGLESLASILMPISRTSAIASILISAIHAAIAIALLVWRWQVMVKQKD